MKTGMRERQARLVVFALSFFGVLIAYVIYLFYHHGEAERNTQAFRTVSMAFSNFIETHEHWPKSENELLNASIVVEGRWSDFDWPRNAESVLDRVQIEYGISDIRDVAKIDSLTKLIQPNDPHYIESVSRDVSRLWDSIENVRKSDSGEGSEREANVSIRR
ncbi:hypothetical protein AB1L42_04335 [Thalassoglobus sp. JC818]|uniref:hypothetical protein n=1 Tax=Thalassoglobus sp. JC818 TaxID=3232136 RepID=UPI00345863EE